MNWNKLMCSERARTTVRNNKGADLRTEFEKDYHRIISSASFRRLQDKTQVFPLDKSDFIRTRLTHSLEVASFARSLGHNIGNRIITEGIDEEFVNQTKDDICSVLECAGLLHDIGNPPFGHFGEDAIRDWFKANLQHIDYLGHPICDVLTEQMVNDFYYFEGNTQALRVVSKLHFMVDENGMNLTSALLATIMKYPGSSLEISYDKNDPNRDIARKKMGYFYADREIFNKVQSNCGTNGRRHPLSFVLEAADDIAYKTADIEDAVKKGLLTYSSLVKELKAISDADNLMEFMGISDGCENVSNNDGDNASKNLTKTDMNKLIAQLQRYFERAVDYGYENPEVYAVSNWLVRVQGLALSSATDSFINNYTDIMAGNYKKELLSDTPAQKIMDALGDIAYRYAFVSGPILKLEVAADNIFDFLLSHLVKALVYYDTPYWKEYSSAVDKKMVGLISPTFMQVYKAYADNINDTNDSGVYEKLYLRLILATDYVSGMTDSFAKRMYQELNGII